MAAFRVEAVRKQGFINNYKSMRWLIPRRRKKKANLFWLGVEETQHQQQTFKLLVCRPLSGNREGQQPQLWLGRLPPHPPSLSLFFSVNPPPEFSPRRTTCSDEVITEDSFSPGKISRGLPTLDSSIIRGCHIKNAPPSNGIICMKGNCPTIHLWLCHSIFSQGHAKKKERERKRACRMEGH